MGTYINIFALPLEDIKLFLKNSHNGEEDKNIQKISEKLLLKNVFIKDDEFQKVCKLVKNSINKNLNLDKLSYENKKLRGSIFFPIEGFTSYYEIFSKILEILDIYINKEDKAYLKIKEINKIEDDEKADKAYKKFMETEFHVKSNRFGQNYCNIVRLKLDKLPIVIFEHRKGFEKCNTLEFEKKILNKLDKLEIYNHKWFIEELINLIKDMKKADVKHLIYTISY